MATTAYPRLAGASDIPRLISHENTDSRWPPPGCHVVPVGHPEPWGLIAGPLDSLPSGRWYVTTLADFLLELPALAVSIMARVARSFTGPIALFTGAIAHWPVIYEAGRGNTMRWIHTVLRGTLGGVEQFQHQTNFGQPGDDPDLSPADCQALAVSLAAKWQTVWNDATITGMSGLAYSKLFPADVKYTEVGVCMQNQTDPTSSDGTGGNLSQEDPTEWAPINGTTGIVGTATQVSLPFEVACAITLNTAVRGARGRGRLYLPPFASLWMASAGKYDAAGSKAAGIGVGKYFSAVTAAHAHVPLVVSRRAVQLHEVEQITVGIIPDSQRRRRWAQLEAPVEAWTNA